MLGNALIVTAIVGILVFSLSIAALAVSHIRLTRKASSMFDQSSGYMRSMGKILEYQAAELTGEDLPTTSPN